MDKIQSMEQRDAIMRFRKVREGMNLSQDQFANILGISESTVKKIESYDRQVSLANLCRFRAKGTIDTQFSPTKT